MTVDPRPPPPPLTGSPGEPPPDPPPPTDQPSPDERDQRLAALTAELQQCAREYEFTFAQSLKGAAISPVPILTQQRLAFWHFHALLEQLVEQFGLDDIRVTERFIAEIRENMGKLGPKLSIANAVGGALRGPRPRR